MPELDPQDKVVSWAPSARARTVIAEAFGTRRNPEANAHYLDTNFQYQTSRFHTAQVELVMHDREEPETMEDWTDGYLRLPRAPSQEEKPSSAA